MRSAVEAVCASFLAFVLTAACGQRPPSPHLIGGKSATEVFADARLAALAEAACRGDVASVTTETRQGVNPNGRGLGDITPLYWALNCQNLGGVEALLKAGADPNWLVKDEGYTPVDIAAGSENTAILQSILKHGGDPNAVYADSPWTALRVAFGLGLAGKGWSNYDALLSAGADINRVHKGETIAEFAASLNQFDKVYQLLARGYSARLPRLLLLTAGADPASTGGQQLPWRDKVVKTLQARGVVAEKPITQ